MANSAVHRLCALTAVCTFLVIIARALALQPAAGLASPGGAVVDCLSIFAFAAAGAAVLLTSKGWSLPPATFEDSGWPSLRSLAAASPALVLFQVILGAGFRHNLVGIAPHVIGAIVVGFLLLMVGTFAVVQVPPAQGLRKTAYALILITLSQLLLGIVAYVARLHSEASGSSSMLAYGTVAHIATGALTMAVSVRLALQVLRDAKPRPESDALRAVTR